jgi:hypothetical protein
LITQLAIARSQASSQALQQVKGNWPYQSNRFKSGVWLRGYVTILIEPIVAKPATGSLMIVEFDGDL